jgi:glucose-1-phosphate cytidylyltransferase
MKVVILAGGLGTRISEYTKNIPKPMIKVGKYPLIVHIIKHYLKYGYNEFYIALGYKGNVIQNYFKKNSFKCKINLINTGINTMTGGRLKRLKKYLGNEDFFLTYGDGVSNVNLDKLVRFHKNNKKLVTLTAVRPPARFGALKLNGQYVSYFKEKSKMDEGWINGGFFVMSPNFLNFIKGDNTFLEREPLENITKLKQLLAYKHRGFWQCVDTVRDLITLKKSLKKPRRFPTSFSE